MSTIAMKIRLGRYSSLSRGLRYVIVVTRAFYGTLPFASADI
jgi:hypothetical protein